MIRVTYEGACATFHVGHTPHALDVYYAQGPWPCWYCGYPGPWDCGCRP